MGYLDALPEPVVQVIRTAFISEYATVSQAGVPIDTPTLVHASADLATLDLVTGLSYPAKAFRARRNPKVGLLLEGRPDQPVVSVSGMAAVRDADLQANMDRCIAEVILSPHITPVDYQTVVRPAVYYFTRIFVEVTPAVVRWWPDWAALDGPPQEWRAPPDTVFPASDPEPPGKASPGDWQPKPWRELVQPAIVRGGPAHLTLIDGEGFPLPFRARAVEPTANGFRVTMPKTAPWSAGQASLSFEGKEIFVGQAMRDGDAFAMTVERALPVLPLMDPPTKAMFPDDDVRAKLMARLEYECARRGQPIPQMPAEPPQPTPGAVIRAQAAEAYHFGGDG